MSHTYKAAIIAWYAVRQNFVQMLAQTRNVCSKPVRWTVILRLRSVQVSAGILRQSTQQDGFAVGIGHQVWVDKVGFLRNDRLAGCILSKQINLLNH